MRVFALCVVAASTLVASLEAQTADPVTVEQLRGWMAEVSNRGRWGASDQLGTLNLITPAVRAQAAALVREGVTVSLSHDLVAGPNDNAIRPMELEALRFPLGITTVAVDVITIMYHGWAYSHVDALSHYAFDGSFYNDVGTDILSEAGPSTLGVDVMRDGIVSRGVLVDVPMLRGVDHLEPRDVVTVDDLEAWEARTGVRVTEGDVLLVRTGRWHREETLGPWQASDSVAGVHPAVGAWLHERGVAALGGDGPNDRNPSVVEGVGDPLHQLTLGAMGMPLFDNLDFEALAEAAAERSRWAFMFVAAPLRVVGGTGSPVNPIVIF